MFNDRLDAARQLAQSLSAYRGQRPLILAIPRGAVPMGHLIAAQLGGELDVVLVRKLRAPYEDEIAVGAIDESGATYLAPWAQELGADAAYLQEETERQMATLRQRRAQYTAYKSPINPQGRLVIVVDDGLATGATMQVALKAVRRHHPAKLICAVPVASAQALERIKGLADEVVCLEVPPDFQGVARFYQVFTQIEDAQVVSWLSQNNTTGA